MLTIDKVIEITLVAIYSNDILNKKLYLKGGQALRFAYDLKTRFSRDADFSTPNGFEDNDTFFNFLKTTLYKKFHENNYYLFDFKFTRKPKFRKKNTPNFWGGWEIEFKLIEEEKKSLPIQNLRREAIIPEGAESSKIKIDISEHEYCNSIDTIKISSVEVKTYSRVLLILEKIRAICQQHPNYPLRSKASNRSRDYYDIERIYSKFLQENTLDYFLNESKKHLRPVFNAKQVDLNLLKKIFDPTFIEIQKNGWEGTKNTITEKIQDFNYYNETLKSIIDKIYT